MPADGFQRRQEQLPAVDVDPLDDSFERRLGVDQVAILAATASRSGLRAASSSSSASRLMAPMLLIWSRSSAISCSTASRSSRAGGSLAMRLRSLTASSPASCFQIDPVVVLHRSQSVCRSWRSLFVATSSLCCCDLQRGQLLAVVRGRCSSSSLARCAAASSSAAACSASSAACCCLLEEQFGERLPAGEHRVVELRELRLPVGKPLRVSASACSRSCWLRWACSSWCRSISTRCSHLAAAICCSVAAACSSASLLLERRESLVRGCQLGFELGGRLLGGRLLVRAVDSTSYSLAAHLLVGWTAVRRRAARCSCDDAARAGRGRRPFCWRRSASLPAARVYAADGRRDQFLLLARVPVQSRVDGCLMRRVAVPVRRPARGRPAARCGARACRPPPAAGRRRACRRRRAVRRRW